jgi:hypothetical protein
LYQINITANTTISQELTNTTDINITTPTEQGCRYCHTSTGTNNSGVYNNTLGGVDTRHHNLATKSAINPLTNVPFGCGNCHPVINGTNGTLIDPNCLDCHNGTAFWENPSRINAGAPHFSVTLNNSMPYPGGQILVIVNAISMNSVTANGVSLTKLSNQAIWDGTITAINGTHSVNVSASNNSVVVWDNSTSYTARIPNIIVTSPMTGAKWVRGTTQTIIVIRVTYGN